MFYQVNKKVLRGSAKPKDTNGYKGTISMTIYLYVKTHNKTGLKYLGKTESKDPHKYRGSGKRWTYHIKKHGYDVTTEILKECATAQEVTEWGIYYSKLWDIVNSTMWANLTLEQGSGGSINKGKKFGPLSDEHKSKISHKLKGISRSIEFKNKISESHKGKTLSSETKKKISDFRKEKYVGELNPMYGKVHSAAVKTASGIRRAKTNSERSWYNNGIETRFLKECPEGWTNGRLNQKPTTLGNKWYNNGVIAVCAKEKPFGNEWVSGMLLKKKP